MSVSVEAVPDLIPEGYHRHDHGGGLVADSAVVPSSVHVPASSRVWPEVKIGENVTIGGDANIERASEVGRNATIGDRVSIGAHAVLGEGSRVSDDVKFPAYAQLGKNVSVADDDFEYIGSGKYSVTPELVKSMVLESEVLTSREKLSLGRALDRLAEVSTEIDSSIETRSPFDLVELRDDVVRTVDDTRAALLRQAERFQSQAEALGDVSLSRSWHTGMQEELEQAASSARLFARHADRSWRADLERDVQGIAEDYDSAGHPAIQGFAGAVTRDIELELADGRPRSTRDQWYARATEELSRNNVSLANVSEKAIEGMKQSLGRYGDEVDLLSPSDGEIVDRYLSSGAGIADRAELLAHRDGGVELGLSEERAVEHEPAHDQALELANDVDLGLG